MYSMEIIKKFFTTGTLVSALIFISVRESPANTALENIQKYPGAQALCDEHVSSNTVHIAWKSFGTRDAVATVAKFFEQSFGSKASAGEHDSLKIVHPANADLIVTVYPKQSAESFPHCDKKPEASTETVVLISQAIR